MPSPLGHALGAAAAGWALAPPLPPATRQVAAGTVRRGLWFAALGMLPDLDLLVAGLHRGPTHSLSAALIAGLAAAALTRNARLGAAAGCAYATHMLLDWLGADSSPPIGIMALWPLTSDYYQVSWPLFEAVWRHNDRPGFWSHNVKAVAKELMVLVPLALVGFRLARGRH